MIRQRRAWGKSHQCGDKAARLVEQKAFDLATRKSCLPPFHLGRSHHMRMGIGGVVFAFWCNGIHGCPPQLSVAPAFAAIITHRRARHYKPASLIGGWKASPVSHGK